MQISSTHSGFNFKSVYESVVTRRDQSAAERAPKREVSYEATAQDDNLAQADATHRETQMLQAAQRVAERTADQYASLPDL